MYSKDNIKLQWNGPNDARHYYSDRNMILNLEAQGVVAVTASDKARDEAHGLNNLLGAI